MQVANQGILLDTASRQTGKNCQRFGQTCFLLQGRRSFSVGLKRGKFFRNAGNVRGSVHKKLIQITVKTSGPVSQKG
jgi:hypothetical protein